MKTLFLCLALFSASAFATTIDDYAPASTPLTGTERMPGNQGSLNCTGCTKRITSQSIANLATKTTVGLANVTNDAQTKAAIVPNTAPAAGDILVGNAGGTAYAPVPLSGDCTLASTGAITCGGGGGGGIVDQTLSADAAITMPGYSVNFLASRTTDPGVQAVSNCEFSYGAAGDPTYDIFRCNFASADVVTSDGPSAFIDMETKNDASAYGYISMAAALTSGAGSVLAQGDVYLDASGSHLNQDYTDFGTPANNHRAIIDLTADASSSDITITADTTTFNSTVTILVTVVSSLPSAVTAGVGARAFVTDATLGITAGIGTAAVGGGSEKVPVYSDGTDWIIGG